MPWPDSKIVKAVEAMHLKKENAELNAQFIDLHKYYEEWNNAAENQENEKRAAYEARIDKLFADNNNWEKFSNQLVGFLNGPKENTDAAYCQWVGENYWAMRFLTSNDIYEISEDSEDYNFIFDLNASRNPYFGYIRLARTFLAAHANKLNVWGSNDPSVPSEQNYKKWQASNYEKGWNAATLTENSPDVLKWKKLLAGKYQPVNNPKAAEEFNTGFKKIQDQLYKYKRNSYGMDNISYLDRVKPEEANFVRSNAEELKAEAKVLAAGPKAGDPKSMLQWVSQLPGFIARKEVIVDIMENNNIPISKEMMDIADAWYDIFSDPQARRLLTGGSSAKIIDGRTDRRMADFEEKYNLWAQKTHKPQFSFKAEADNSLAQDNEKGEEFAAFAKELKDAKTTFNSNEYEAIISFAENWKAAPKELHSDSPAKDKASQLVCLKSVINAYLNHKGKDGVNKNVYNKLAAVEKLDQFVSEKLKDIKEADLPDGKSKAFFRQIQQDAHKDNIVPTYKDKDLIAQKVKTAQAFGNNTSVDECAMTLKCMDKIISRSETRKNELKDIQKDFFNNPGKKEYSSGKLAADAWASGVRKTPVDKSAKVLFDAGFKDSYYEFDESTAAAYNYAKRNNLGITLHVSGNLEDLSWKGAEALIASCAKQAPGSDKMKSILNQDLTAVKNAVRSHLRKVDTLEAASMYASAEYNDKELIEKWPDIKSKMGCYKEVFKDETGVGKTISDIIKKYDNMEERIIKLAQPYAKQMQENNLQKANAAKQQESNAYSMI